MAEWQDKLREGGEMKDLRFMPVGKVYLTPGQRQSRYIRQLERAVLVLAGTCIFLAIVAGMLWVS